MDRCQRTASKWQPPAGPALAWRAVVRAAVVYSETDTSAEADRLFERNAARLAADILRWAWRLPEGEPVTIAGGREHGPERIGGRFYRASRWDRVTRAAHALANVLADDGATDNAVRIAEHRLRKAGWSWARASARWTSPTREEWHRKTAAASRALAAKRAALGVAA